MSNEIVKGLCLLFSVVCLLPCETYWQEEKKGGQGKKETTKIRVQVTGGEQEAPGSGPTVYVEWKEDGETKGKEGKTNRQGLSGPYRVPRLSVFVQVTT